MDGITPANLPPNAMLLLNDWKVVQLYESQAFINARRLIAALQPFLEQHNICTFQASLCSLISEKYVAHFQDCFLRESHRLDNLNNGLVSMDVGCTQSTNPGKDYRKEMQSDFDRFLVDASQHNGESIKDVGNSEAVVNGLSKQLCNSSLNKLMEEKEDVSRNRRMSADDGALEQINEDNSDVFKKKKPKKRGISMKSSQKPKSRTKSEDDVGYYKENGDASNKGFVSNVWNRLRRGSTSRIKGFSSFPEKPPQDVSVRIDMPASYLVIGQTLPGENMAFQRSRMVLTQFEKDYLIEIFSPTKSTKAKYTIMGCDITEVRPTTAVEMPDIDYTFVIKASGSEYVVKLNGDLDFATWLSEIEECSIKAGHKKLHVYECHKLPFLPERFRESPPNSGTDVTSSDDTGQQMSDFSTTPPNLGKAELVNNLDEDTQSISTTQLGSWDSKATAPLLTPSTSMEESEEEGGPRRSEVILPKDLVNFPWYHMSMTRIRATQLVLGGRQGVFLMRLSETRQAGHVLTFNVQGRVKHLRLSIDTGGKCRVQHLKFNSVLDMLEHFRSNSIPLESGGSTHVYLTDYVINENCNPNVDTSENQEPTSAPTDEAADTEPTTSGDVSDPSSPTNQRSPASCDSDVAGPSGLQSINSISSAAPVTSQTAFVNDGDVTVPSHVRAVDNPYAFS